jgi:hypothetical protein
VDPFDTLAEAEAASTPNDFIYVFQGDNTTNKYNAGIKLKDGQKLLGEGVDLIVAGKTLVDVTTPKPAKINDTAEDTVQVLANTANGKRTGIEIRGLDITSAAGNAIDVTSANAVALDVLISDDVISGSAAGFAGIDVTAGSTGAQTLAVSNNTITANGTGLNITRTAGTLTITGFINNVVTGATTGSGIVVTGPVTFDAGAGAPVLGGATVIGDATNSVGQAGLVISGMTGTLNFVDLDIFAGGGAGLSVGGTGTATTNLTVPGVSMIEANGGPAVNLSAATINVQPSSIKSTNSPTTGVSLDTVNGTFSAGATSSITTATGTDFNVNAGTATISYAGTITNTAGRSVSITNKTGGSTTFTNAITDTGTGIFMNSNGGSTMSFTGGVSLTTGANDAFTATGGGTVTVTGTNTIATTTGIGLNVANTTIGAGGLTFRSISAGTAASGPASGIILNNTGALGGLTVAGTGGVGTGGTIQRTTSHGVSMTSTRNPSFTSMQIQNTAGSGINGTQVTNFTFANGTIDNSGTGGAADDSNISFNDSLIAANLTGTLSVTNSTLTNSRFHGVDIQNVTGTLSDVTISGNTFTSATSVATSLGSAVRLIALGSASAVGNVTRATLANNVINNFPSGAGFVIQGGNSQDTAGAPSGTMGTPGSASDIIAITGNRMDGGTGGIGNQPDRFITAAVNGRGQGNFNISNNGTVALPIKNIDGVVIELSAFGATNVTANVSNNVITANNAVSSSGIGIGCDADSLTTTTDNATLTTTITGNNVSQTDGPGIYALARNSSCTHVTRILNNTVAAPATTTAARAGIRVDSGSASGNTTVCLEISGNTTGGSTNTATSTTSPGINLRKQGTVAATNAFGIEGLSPSPTGTPNVENHVNGMNTSSTGNFGVGGTALLSGTSGFVSCVAP